MRQTPAQLIEAMRAVPEAVDPEVYRFWLGLAWYGAGMAHSRQVTPPEVATAARQLVDLMTCALVERGEPSTQARIAAVVGVSPSRVSHVRYGRNVTLDTLSTWADRWAKAGYPALWVVVEQGTVRVEKDRPARAIDPSIDDDVPF